MNESRKPLDHFKVMMILLAVWIGLFAVTVVTEARTMARGVMPLISGVLVLWIAYWTIQWLRGSPTPPPTQKQPDNAVASKDGNTETYSQN